MPNYYEILGVSNDANPSELKKAYRSLSLKYHPDRNTDDDAKSRFQEINQAYETLSDPEKKTQYDHQLKFGGAGGGMPFPGGMHFPGGMPFAHMSSMNEFNDIQNIFQNLFGGGGMPGGPNIRVFQSGPGNFHAEFSTSFQQPPPAIVKTVDITMDQCYHGCDIQVDYDRWTIINNTKINEKQTVDIHIPPGLNEGDRLTMGGIGNMIHDGLKGDVHFVIHIDNKSDFQRHGLDLHLHKKISLKDALCGFSVDIPHFNGKLFCLNNNSNPSIIKPGFKKMIPGLGMVRDGQTGNLVVEFDVEFPEELTESQRTSLKEIL